jgi:hypothetical protein
MGQTQLERFDQGHENDLAFPVPCFNADAHNLLSSRQNDGEGPPSAHVIPDEDTTSVHETAMSSSADGKQPALYFQHTRIN